MKHIVAPRMTYSFRLNTAEASLAGRDLAFILGTLLGRVKAASAVIYRTREERDQFQGIAASFEASAQVPDLSVSLSVDATVTLKQGERPFQTSIETDPRFAGLPEVLQFGLKKLLVFPLRDRDGLSGVMTIGRTSDQGFDSRAVQLALPAARIAGAVIERDSLREELRSRKLMERAKGILQRERAISEEDAYLQLCRQSRQLRRPVADIAREIIDGALLRKTA